MRVLIVSDSHGLTKELDHLIEKHKDVDYFIHCGDSELEPDSPSIQSFLTVRGNCDFNERFPEELVKEIGDRTLFVTHGHLFSVKSSLQRLSYRAKELSADIVCFGHSHFLGVEMIEETLFINPGSIRLPRGRMERTYVILEILEGSYQFDVYEIELGKIQELSQNFPLSI